ncbi:Calmodulin-binding transcription activator homolog 1 [Caenorhabditis elegans]|uniref:Isoform c of Calmodulin-binding transcription activator homolog 1 n=1 Tax=Caenorhabditis elegans TaxID=6239 RepID=H2KY84-3|nr:Calmodulin-binding transcription activator homolog 1 [Caenorhabditis elegans]CCD61747.1 Calmodulin-binding transcription activator homolog 1 [Caenorhabditis elegans]|eukprot:NP_001022314.1 CAMTA (CAlModulin-binding Transcriptional activator) [Caenorhabditis elegans]
MVYSQLNPKRSALDADDHLLYRGFCDDEQRDVYEAAMVIQRAYRVYRARSTTRRQEDIERRAALKIQGCYRRYKQFCYFKKLHNAAIVVQKHFRMRKRDDKEEGAVEAVIASVPEHPTLDGQSICIQVPKTNSTMLRERAATTIQVAYRYRHRKRQAAARKIQNFMRQNRNKLRKMHALNEDGTSPARKPAEINATNEILMVNGKEMLTTMPQNSFRSVQHHPQQQFHIDQHNVIIHGTN